MVTAFWYIHDPNFGILSWFWRCKEHPCSLSPYLGLWLRLEDPDWGFTSWFWYKYSQWSLIYLISKFWLSILILKVQRTSMSWSPNMGLWWTLEVSDWGLTVLFWFVYGCWCLVNLCSEVGPSILILKVKRTSLSFKTCSWALEDYGGFWLGFRSWKWFGYGHWSLIHPCS